VTSLRAVRPAPAARQRRSVTVAVAEHGEGVGELEVVECQGWSMAAATPIIKEARERSDGERVAVRRARW
jgi:hypothetical protein